MVYAWLMQVFMWLPMLCRATALHLCGQALCETCCSGNVAFELTEILSLKVFL